MFHLKAFTSAIALGATLVAAWPSAAQAQSRSGIDLHPNRDCGIQVYLSNSAGVAVPKADSRLSGSYVFHLYQAIPTSDLNLRLDGRFSGGGAHDTALARSHFGLGYVVRGGYRGMDEIRDAELGQDAMLRGSLSVYDQAGRLTCSTQVVDVMPMSLLTFQRPVVQRNQNRIPTNGPTPAEQARERIAAANAAAPQQRLTPAQCARLRSARPAQCRYD
ncbi:hypothetical protein [uncultured Maricaulis sp.]|uniref:hypothetical protein n=1 Tax=uncultured Maricaulis sp. TaxID=174710 RepID=UPI00261B6161|nr:hypothetical protein [uncultured Maricaulis sp.]